MNRSAASFVRRDAQSDRRCRIAFLLSALTLTCCGVPSLHAQDDNGGAIASAAAAAAAAARAEPVAIIDGVESPPPKIKMGDPAVIAQIIEEGKNHSQVMQHLEHLTKQIGTRLTGSSNAEKANKWCMELYKKWGLSNARIEEWGTIPVRFDRGPSTGKVLTEKDGAWQPAMDLEFTTYSWSAGTKGAVRGPVVKMPKNDEEYTAVKDKLKGAWILLPEPEASASGQRRRGAMSARYASAIEIRKRVKENSIDPATLLYDERILFDGVNGFIAPTGELVLTGSAPTADPRVSAWRALDFNNIPPDVGVIVRKTDYQDIVKRLDAGENFQLEFNLEHTFTPGPIPCYNTIAEIPGTIWPDQVVIVSGHLDSWDGPGSEGALDNGTGTATTLETARILAAVGARPKRTIRFIDWTGEEQGLLGSRAYVAKHKAEVVAGVSACLVDDGGTEYNAGMPAAEQMVPMLAAASAPVNNVFYSETDKRFLNVNIRNTGSRIDTHGSSDHASFNQVGVPGFFWDEGPRGEEPRSDYNYAHHTQYDTLDRAIPEYLVQSATCAAVMAYNLACADELLPRVIPETKPDVNTPVATATPKPSQPEKKEVAVAPKRKAKPVWP